MSVTVTIKLGSKMNYFHSTRKKCVPVIVRGFSPDNMVRVSETRTPDFEFVLPAERLFRNE